MVLKGGNRSVKKGTKRCLQNKQDKTHDIRSAPDNANGLAASRSAKQASIVLMVKTKHVIRISIRVNKCISAGVGVNLRHSIRRDEGGRFWYRAIATGLDNWVTFKTVK